MYDDWLVQGQVTLCVDWLRLALAPLAVIGESQGLLYSSPNFTRASWAP